MLLNNFAHFKLAYPEVNYNRSSFYLPVIQ